jgi:hypothetical protein
MVRQAQTLFILSPVFRILLLEFGFELALFCPRPKPLIFSYYLIIKELTPILLNLKLALFFQIILFSVFRVLSSAFSFSTFLTFLAFLLFHLAGGKPDAFSHLPGVSPVFSIR